MMVSWSPPKEEKTPRYQCSRCLRITSTGERYCSCGGEKYLVKVKVAKDG